MVRCVPVEGLPGVILVILGGTLAKTGHQQCVILLLSKL